MRVSSGYMQVLVPLEEIYSTGHLLVKVGHWIGTCHVEFRPELQRYSLFCFFCFFYSERMNLIQSHHDTQFDLGEVGWSIFMGGCMIQWFNLRSGSKTHLFHDVAPVYNCLIHFLKHPPSGCNLIAVVFSVG